MRHPNYRTVRPRRSASTRAQVRQRTGRMRDLCHFEEALDQLHRGFLAEILDEMEEGL